MCYLVIYLGGLREYLRLAELKPSTSVAKFYFKALQNKHYLKTWPITSNFQKLAMKCFLF